MIDINILGTIYTSYKDSKSAPRQGYLSEEIAQIELLPEFAEAASTLKTGQKIVVLYWADRANRSVLQTRTPFGPDIKGVFATRSPNRPNPINICEVVITGIENNVLLVQGIDALDGSPLLDIKASISKTTDRK